MSDANTPEWHMDSAVEMPYAVLGLLIGGGIGYYVGKSLGTDTTRRGSKSALSSRS